MIKLTRPDGTYVWISKKWVQCVSLADSALNPNAVSLVTLSGSGLAVLEEPEAIVTKLEGQDGDAG